MNRSGGTGSSGGMNRLLSIVRNAELAVILAAAVMFAVSTVSAARQLWRTREARGDLRILRGIGMFNWTMDRGKTCPPDAAAIARHIGFGRTVDPWGTPYQVRCAGEEMPVPFSAGPDRAVGTGDDFSWP